MKKLLIFLLSFVLLSGTLCVSAYSDSYTYNYWNEAVPSPSGYTATSSYTGNMLGIGSMEKPSDLFVAADGCVYISDTGNNRVICLNPDYSVGWVRDSFNDNGRPLSFKTPDGIFVDKDNNIYLCLTDDKIVLKADQKGNILQKYTSPDSTILSDTFEFKPSSVIVSDTGTVYVLIDGFYLGALVYNNAGEFLTFFGSNEVKVTPKMVTDRLLRKFMTEEQKAKLSRYVPVQYDGFDIDSYNFIYTCTKKTDSQEIRRLNALSENVLANKENMGDLQTAYIMGSVVDTSFTDICVDKRGFISALDTERARIFQYDSEGELLMIFGGSGDGLGYFTAPCAIDEQDERILVLDKELGSFTVFETTKYGSLLRDGTTLYQDGLYAEAKEIWLKVLKKNVNCELAYDGLGKASFANEEYEAAMSYFKKSNNRSEYSEVYKEYRALMIKKGFSYVACAFLIVAAIVAVLIFLKKKRNKNKSAEPKTINPNIASILRLLSHPTDECYEIKYKKSWSIPIACLVLFMLFISEIVRRQLTAFIFNNNNLNDFNILVILVSTVGVFLLFVIINWAVTTLLNGKGKIKEIFCGGCYSLIPYIVMSLLSVAVSHFSILDEQAFLSLISLVGIIWSAIIFISVLRVIHEYSFKKVFASLFLTIVGMAFVVFILMLFISLVEQLFSFVSSIYIELMYRR